LFLGKNFNFVFNNTVSLHANEAIVIGDVCLLPNFCFKPAVLEALDKLFQSDTVNSYTQFVLSKSLLSQETIADSI